MKEERYTNLILEEMRGQFEAVIEIVGDSNERIKDLPTRDEFNRLQADVAAIKQAVTDTNIDQRLLERRVDKLEQHTV